jgi:hypothetical protein
VRQLKFILKSHYNTKIKIFFQEKALFHIELLKEFVKERTFAIDVPVGWTIGKLCIFA